MPRIDELVNCLGKAKYISILDLARGYWQVPMAEKDWDKTAFATPYGLYQFTVTGSSSHLSKDDGQIHTRTWDIHSSISRRSHSVQWNISGTFTASTMSDGDPTSRWADGQSQKVPVCYDTSVCTWDMWLEVEGLGWSHQRLKQINHLQYRQHKKKRVNSFLGITGYYTRVIPEFATIAAPLTNMICKNCPNKVKWTKQCEEAFD